MSETTETTPQRSKTPLQRAMFTLGVLQRQRNRLLAELEENKRALAETVERVEEFERAAADKRRATLLGL